MEKEKPIWFKNKYFGWGWRPVTCQGWLVVLVYIALIALLAFWFKHQTRQFAATNVPALKALTALFVVKLAALTAILVMVGYKFGEKPKWHWGLGDDHKQ